MVYLYAMLELNARWASEKHGQCGSFFIFKLVSLFYHHAHSISFSFSLIFDARSDGRLVGRLYHRLPVSNERFKDARLHLDSNMCVVRRFLIENFKLNALIASLK